MEALCEVEFKESPIPDGVERRCDFATIKRDGCIWRIYKNDADPFPSNPHAHNIESGLKLDLATGALYLGRQASGKSISRKNLKFIRLQAETKGVSLPTMAV